MNVDDLVAIDVHAHVEISADSHPSLPAHLMAGSAAYFNVADDGRTPGVPEIAAYYRERRMAAVVFTVDAETATGHPPISSEEIAESCAEHADVLIPFATVDPWRGQAAVRFIRGLAGRYSIRGVKFHPSLQAFHPNDPMAYPLYDTLQELGLIALFHSGQTGIGARLPGGGKIRLKYANPLALDDVAADFPDLKIVIAHPSFPWQDEALAIATHKPLVHIDLSGWSPKYFPPQLVRYANTLLKDKVLFGSDFPLITPDRWLTDFDTLDIKPEVRPLILKHNAARLLNL
ncbi:MAG TPA: amidohydrolase family protein [Actinophytocola sp.]|uniref:amidohydrolase family protein n=1 Tax=Actinophytocola sp. TaxID=1872138 RepID=UPI002DDD7577|nr:amidohydrolase family protein [Actinophytocola sp.]HEV2778701.1 amidohydrolase family protein [Actinophytocola sp.]